MSEKSPPCTGEESFCIRAYESGEENRATLPAYCNYLQEAAGNHAHALGLGIHELQDAGFTWMLSRLRLVVNHYAAWRDTVRVRTWPSGNRGRLAATRDFLMSDAMGRELLRGTSEWLYVDLATLRVTRLPPAFLALVSEATPAATVPEPAGRIPDFGDAEWSATLPVRHSDHDFNNHVNNAHYVEWALECLPEAWRTNRRACELDISFRAAARWGDTVLSEAARDGETSLLHRIRRAADHAVLAVARTKWR